MAEQAFNGGVDEPRWEWSIRYEGGDAALHTIDLNQLGESMQGFARILAMTANFIETGKINRHLDAMSVQVLAKPVPEHHCYEVLASIKSLLVTKEFFAGLASGSLPAIVQYVLGRRDKEEMKYLSSALEKQMELNAGNSEKTMERLLSTIDKLADALRPSVKRALAPVGKSCHQIDLYTGGQRMGSLDAELKQDITGAQTAFPDHARRYTGVITGLDMATGACKMTLDGEDERIAGQILDPVVFNPGNPYAEAMASASKISVLAKAETDQDGAIIKLYVMDTFNE